ncbi:MAG: hypothetical protein ABI723_26550 [Bacteroidia bacterium]
MKKSNLIIAIGLLSILFTKNVIAQWVGSAPNVKLDVTSGFTKVCIGNTNPISKLQVPGTTGLNLSTAHGLMVLGNKGAFNLAFDPQDIQARSNGSAATLYQNFYGGDVQLGGGVSGVNPFIYKGTSGYVGIGSASPTSPLDIVNHGASNITSFDGGNSMFIAFKENGIYRGYMGSYSGAAEDVDFGTGVGNATGNLNLTIQALPKLTIKSDGNVGIGTLTPGAKFHVSANETSTHGKAAAIEISNTNPIGGNWFLRAGAPGTATPTRGFSIANDNGYYFVIDSIGQVAVNTTTPANGYAFSVGGKVICEEIRVLLKASWPDYVFDKDYKLNSINELTNFINENYHLPGLPSTCEVEQNGIDIAQMQSKIVEKMEQLTLYIIKQNEQINKLTKENEEIKKVLNSK